MKKFSILKYKEIKTKKVSKYETSFEISPLERGFANTFGNAIRRTMLSSLTSVAPIAVRIKGALHEFQTIPNVVEDIVNIIINLKEVKFVYKPEIFKDGEIIKLTLKSTKGKVTAEEFKLPLGVEIVNSDQHIATTSKEDALELELFIMSGRGFVSFEENKEFIKKYASKFSSKLAKSQFIAVDSDFSPIVKVSYASNELNSASTIIEEKLTINVKTNGTIKPKDAIAQAANIMIAHLEILSNASNLDKEDIFMDKAEIDNAKKKNSPQLKIISLNLSARSYNCLRRAGFESVDELTKLSYEELIQIKNLGKKSIDEIIEKLADHNIVLEGTK